MTERHYWYRKTSWTESDREDFETRFARTRKASRAQYLKIQAWSLFEAGLVRESLSLIDRMFSDYPDRLFSSSGLLLRAKCYTAIGDLAHATDAFRMSIQTERDFPNVRTNVPLEFAQFVVQNELSALFREALSVLDEVRGVGTQFPSCDYMHYSLKACLLDSLGMDGAKSNVEMANSAAGRTHSGFWKHPTLGLVEEEPNWLKERMDRIIGG
jgi:tetratricopeptide (TPR) repeat protein